MVLPCMSTAASQYGPTFRAGALTALFVAASGCGPWVTTIPTYWKPQLWSKRSSTALEQPPAVVVVETPQQTWETTADLPTKTPPSPQSPKVAADDRPRPNAGAFWVAGCNVECVNCSSIDDGTYVKGFVEGHPIPAFAGRPPTGGSYPCATTVNVGERVTLRAHPSPLFEFVRWRRFGSPYNADYCPCHEQTGRTCRIEIDAQVAARYTRAYCGAVWRRKRVTGEHTVGH
jgi:hypothetical protein